MLRKFCVFATLLLALVVRSPAQNVQGQIVGRVADPTGASVAGAKVRAVNEGTHVVTPGVSNNTGDFTLPSLVSGNYDVTVEVNGFKKFEQKGIAVHMQDTVTLRVALEVGSVTTTLEVESTSVALETSTASLGQVVDDRRIQDLPVNYENALMLAQLGPGVANLSTNNQTQTFTSSTPSSLAINGVGTNDIQFTLDGAPNNAGGHASVDGNIAYTPPSGTISEFKIETAIFDASRGFGAGSNINLSLKSGTDTLHGQLYDFLQNPALNANSFFSNKNGLGKDINRQNQWGFNVNGPLVLPHLYNGKNKTFWMFGYEGIANSYPKSTAQLYTIPTAAERGGNFSALLSGGTTYQIYDPTSTVATSGGHFSRSPFPGNIIPNNRLDTVAPHILNTYLNLTPNLPGNSDGTNNYVTPLYQQNHFLSTVFRFDENFSEKHRLFVRGNYSNLDEPNTIALNNATGSYFIRDNRGIGLQDTYIFSPSTILSTRLSYTRYVQGSNPASLGLVDLGSLGFSQNFINEVGSVYKASPALPTFAVSGLPTLGNSAINLSGGDIYSGGADLTWVRGRHTIQFGGEYRVYRDVNFNLGNSFGSLSYGSTYTVATDTTPAATFGQGLASFMLGLPTSGGIDMTASYAQQYQVGGLYLQDIWKVTPHLTVTIGLRAEREGPDTERFNRSVTQFDSVDANPLSAAATKAYAANPIPQVPASSFKVLGGLQFAGVNGQSRQFWHTNNGPLMPRIGLAYQLDQRTVIRAGYAVFDDLTRIDGIQTGYSQTTSLVASTNNGLSYAASSANPFPNGLLPVQGAAQGLLTGAGAGISAFPQDAKRPYSQRWQVGIERLLPGQTLVQVDYVGNRGTDLWMARQYDTIPAQYLSRLPIRDKNVINTLSAAVANPFYPSLPGTSLAGSTTTVGQLLLPFPEFTGVSVNTNQGYSWYHSLQTQVQKRFSHGYTLNAAFTWSKYMEATNYLNASDALPEKVVSSQDRPFRFVTSGIYELPFGHGKHFGANWRGFGSAVSSGWQVQGIYQWQSGDALGFGNSILFGTLSDIPLSSDQRNISAWLNNAAFDSNTNDKLANNIRAMSSRFAGIRGPGIDMVDLSILKNTQIRERLKLQLRGEFINALNHPQFSDPSSSDPTSKSFGTITNTSQLPRTVQLGLKILF